MGETDGNRAPVTLGEIAANTRLLSALEKHDVIEVNRALDDGANVNIVGTMTEMPLMIAIRMQFADLVEKLLRNGADPTQRDKFGRYMMIKQCMSWPLGKTPLHLAAMLNLHVILVGLLEVAVAVDVQDEDGATPLHIAAANGSFEACQTLLRFQANVNAFDKLKSTPLHFAAEHGNLSVLRLLLEHQAIVNHANVIGNTPLHRAASNGWFDAVWCLLANFADATLSNAHGRIPLDMAKRRGHTGIVEVLQHPERIAQQE